MIWLNTSHKALAQTIEELINNQPNIFGADGIVDKEVEQLVYFYYRRFIKKQPENVPAEISKSEREEMVEVDLWIFR